MTAKPSAELGKTTTAGESRLQEGNKKYVTVSKPCKGGNPDELDLEVGDVVEVLESKDNDWSVGAINGRQGLYRNEFVQELKTEASSSKQARGDNLEDLFSTLKEQISSSDWLKENTAEKWVNQNPELAKEYMDAAKKS